MLYDAGAEVGTVITTITANDVDTNPAITYNFAADGNPHKMFSIDKFSGKITLAVPLDHETRAEYMLQVEASDTAHIATTSITVQVVDENDNPPIFTQQAYQVALPELSQPGTSVTRVRHSHGTLQHTCKFILLFVILLSYPGPVIAFAVAFRLCQLLRIPRNQDQRLLFHQPIVSL